MVPCEPAAFRRAGATILGILGTLLSAFFTWALWVLGGWGPVDALPFLLALAGLGLATLLGVYGSWRAAKGDGRLPLALAATPFPVVAYAVVAHPSPLVPALVLAAAAVLAKTR